MNTAYGVAADHPRHGAGGGDGGSRAGDVCRAGGGGSGGATRCSVPRRATLIPARCCKSVPGMRDDAQERQAQRPSAAWCRSFIRVSKLLPGCRFFGRCEMARARVRPADAPNPSGCSPGGTLARCWRAGIDEAQPGNRAGMGGKDRPNGADTGFKTEAGFTCKVAVAEGGRRA